MSPSTETRERELLALYLPIKDRLPWTDRTWLDWILVDGSDAEIEDAVCYLREKIDEIQRTHAEKEA